MESILVAIALVACPIGMGLMMWFMAKGMRSGSRQPAEAATDLQQLRAEHRRLGAEIERLEDESSPPWIAERQQ